MGFYRNRRYMILLQQKDKYTKHILHDENVCEVELGEGPERDGGRELRGARREKFWGKEEWKCCAQKLGNRQL
jgi:hypothetical protein